MGVFSVLMRAYNRTTLWRLILNRIKGSDAKTQWGLLLSAFLDTLSYIVCPSLAISPKVYVSGIVCFKFRQVSVHFFVRKFSDDLYNVLPGREGDVNDLIIKLLKKGDVFVDVVLTSATILSLLGRSLKIKGK